MLDFFSRAARRLQRVFRPGRIDRVLDDELRFHIESETAAKVASGMDQATARRLTLAELGGVDRWHEEVREQRPGGSIAQLWREVRLASRSLLRSPAYTLPAIGTLALGMAALAAIASLTSAILLRPLPYERPGRLVALWEHNIPRNRAKNVVGTTVFEAWRGRSRTLESLTALMPESDVWLNAGSPERVFGARVSPSMFELFGRRPALGPGFSGAVPADEVVLSYGFWVRRLGADSSIIGRPITLSGEPVTVVGVMPNDFTPVKFGWMGDQEFWRPLDLSGTQNWGRFLVVAGRMKQNATLATLNQDLSAIAQQLREEKLLTDGWDAHAVLLVDEMTAGVKPALLALAIASLLLLAMVLTNSSLLTLAHLRQRATDRALRAALGATRWRLRRERVVMSALLGATGAVVGALLTLVALPLLVRVLPPDMPRVATVRLDAFAATVILAATLFVTLVLALLPAGASSSKLDLAAQSTRLTKRNRTPWLIAAEAALALVLAVLASLTVRSFDRLRSVGIGFDPAGVHTLRVSIGSQPETVPRSATFERILQELRAIPGVSAAGLTSVRPLGDGGPATTIAPLGASNSEAAALPVADVRVVDPAYFDVLDLTRVAGRPFSGRELPDSPPLAIVNGTLVRTLWPDAANAVGRKFQLNMYDDAEPEVIAVVDDVRLLSPRQAARPTVYLSAAQFPSSVFDIVVRSELSAATLMPSVRAAVDRTVPGTPVYNVARVEGMLHDAMATERVTALLLGFFAAAALLLVAVGVYGVFAGDIARRRQELGVRMALGASSQRLVRTMLLRTLTIVATGLIVGGALSVLATRVLRSVLYNVPTSDAASHLAAVFVVVVTALAATLVPALQATRLDPVRALRAE